VVKEADKGNAVVILDREYYRDKILDKLKDGMYYEETDTIGRNFKSSGFKILIHSVCCSSIAFEITSLLCTFGNP
jgi:hypothetical protein